MQRERGMALWHMVPCTDVAVQCTRRERQAPCSCACMYQGAPGSMAGRCMHATASRASAATPLCTDPRVSGVAPYGSQGHASATARRQPQRVRPPHCHLCLRLMPGAPLGGEQPAHVWRQLPRPLLLQCHGPTSHTACVVDTASGFMVTPVCPRRWLTRLCMPATVSRRSVWPFVSPCSGGHDAAEPSASAPAGHSTEA